MGCLSHFTPLPLLPSGNHQRECGCTQVVLRCLPGNYSPCSYKHSCVYFMSTHLLQATHMLCVELAPPWVLGYKTMPVPMPCQLHSQGGNMTI